MSREEFSKLIGPYLDGELSAEEREKVEEYLAGSEEYRHMAAEIEGLTRIVREDAPPEVSDEKWKEILSSLRSDGATEPFTVVGSRRRWLAPLAGLAAILVIGLFLWSAGSDSPPGEPPTPRKDYASTEDADHKDKVRIDTVEPEEKEKTLQPTDPRFEEE
jgi:anti-sigma factor RsiW